MSRRLPAGVREITLGAAPGLAALAIENDFCSATIALQGAQLLRFETAAGKPLLWLSEKAAYQQGKAIRGGIPLCFPWFGPHADDPALPAHGFARNREWALESALLDDDGHHLCFVLEDDAATRALWPHSFHAELRMHLGAELGVELTVENRDAQPVPITFAFHSYFPVADIAGTRVLGLEGVDYIDQLHPARARFTQEGSAMVDGETDRIYLDAPGRYHIMDAEGVIAIEADGCRSAVLWNPWVEKTARLGDMAPDAWAGMVCLECGNIAADRVLLGAGERRVFSVRIQAGVIA